MIEGKLQELREIEKIIDEHITRIGESMERALKDMGTGFTMHLVRVARRIKQDIKSCEEKTS